MKLLQHLIDERASNEPGRVLYIIPCSEKTTDDGFQEITYSRMADAVNKAAFWIRANVQGPLGQNLAFIGPQDLRYLIFILAANKAGHQLMLLSPRNSDDAQRHLLGVAKCRYFLCGQRFEKSTREIVSTSDGHVAALVTPSLGSLLEEGKANHIPFDVTWEGQRHKPFVVLHTSGTSTGKPKPIILNHGYYAVEELLPRFPKVQGQPLSMAPYDSNTRNCHAMPLFHVGALFATLFKPVLQAGTVALLPGDTQIEADLVLKTLGKAKCNRLSASPTMIENLLSRPDAGETLAKLEMISFGSGPMPDAIGDALIKINPRAVNMYGSTEMNLLPTLHPGNLENDWQYLRFHPWTGATLEPIGGDESMCELVIKPTDAPGYEAVQPAFENWPDSSEYRSKDVFVRHPQNENLWRWYSRVDDVITFETGEKLNPSTMENVISAHPKVASAVIVGQRRMQPALLIEPKDHVPDHKAFLEELWPTVQRANSEAPAYGKIVKQLILLSEERFRRTPKGTIQRMKTEEMLAQEIAALYEGSGESVYSTVVDMNSQDNIREYVRSIVHDVLDISDDFGEDANMFDHGLDSLRAAELVRAFNTVLRRCVSNGHAPPRIDVSTVYGDPTIKNLAEKLYTLATHGEGTDDGKSWSESATRLLARHTPVLATGAAMLTGSTGSLGAHLLHLLLHDQTYTHVYCLNRSEGAGKAYFETFPSDRKLSQKVTFLQTSAIWSPFFGLPGKVVYRELLTSVRTVIHNAWPVNFLMAVEAANPGAYSSSFEPQFDGVANLIRFCAESRHKARLVYISSLSSVMSGTIQPIPEEIVTDTAAPGPGGYARSKWTTECIMHAAACDYPGTLAPPIVIRPGQISGPLAESVEPGAVGVGSVWNAREAIASIFISSNTVGALPSSIGFEEKLRWVPVDIVAKTTLEVIHHVDKSQAGIGSESGASAWNVINIQEEDGKEKTWNSVVPAIRSRLENKFGKKFDVVSMSEWIKRVEAHGVSDGKQNPAIKLLDFMGSLAETTAEDGMGSKMETTRTKQASKSLRELGSVQEAWIEYWMQGWGL